MLDPTRTKNLVVLSLATLLGPASLLACDPGDSAQQGILNGDEGGEGSRGDDGNDDDDDDDGDGDDEGEDGGGEGEGGDGDEGEDEGDTTGEDDGGSGGECGNGVLDDGEDCDDGNDDNTDDCTNFCNAAACGDGIVWLGHEECDDGNFYSIPEEPPDCGDDCTPLPPPCNEDCSLGEGCYWDIEAAPLPIEVFSHQYTFADLDFDHDCNLVMTGANTQAIYRISHVDGSVSAAAQGIPVERLVGLTSHPDGRIYVTTRNPEQIWAMESDDSMTFIADLPDQPFSITVAPNGFGNFGGQLIWGGETKVWATDPGTGVSTVVGGPLAGTPNHSDIAFSPDGTLYAVRYSQGMILTIAADGTQSVFKQLNKQTEGLLFSADGTELYVAYTSALGSVSVPGGILTEGPTFQINGGAFPTGTVLDAAGRLIHTTNIGPTINGISTAGISSWIP